MAKGKETQQAAPTTIDVFDANGNRRASVTGDTMAEANAMAKAECDRLDAARPHVAPHKILIDAGPATDQ